MQYANGSSYLFKTGSNSNIEYAKVIQGDGEIYYYDKPIDGVRTVYRYGGDKIIGSMSVASNGTISHLK